VRQAASSQLISGDETNAALPGKACMPVRASLAHPCQKHALGRDIGTTRPRLSCQQLAFAGRVTARNVTNTDLLARQLPGSAQLDESDKLDPAQFSMNGSKQKLI
jgi:hypothetical protein